MIHQGDCVEVMARMPPDSVDSVCTDPPYGLGFMSKQWDTVKASHLPPSAEAQDTPLARFRTGKGPAAVAFDGNAFQAWCEAWGREALRVTKPGGYLLAFGGTRTHHRLVCGLEDAGWIIRDELDWVYASGFPKGKANLKPAHEPIVLARKPGPLRPLAIDACRIGTTVETWPATRNYAVSHREPGGNGITVETGPAPAGRWPSNLLLQDPELFDTANPYVVGSGAVAVTHDAGYQRERDKGGWQGPGEGTVTSVGDTGGYSRFFLIPKSARADREPVLRGQLERVDAKVAAANNPICESCGLSKYDRGQGVCACEIPQWRQQQRLARENLHPTVKPVDLMRHLIRLVTPSGGTILDPFLGSGTTGIAAELEGFPWIGIEKEPEYVAIAEARLNGVQRGLGLDVPAPTRQQKLGKGHAGWGGDRAGPNSADFFTRVKPPEEAA